MQTWNNFIINLAAVFFGIIFAAIVVTAMFPPPTPPRCVESVECGACGAHVVNWWYTMNDAQTEWVKVCGKCYDAID